MGFFDSVRKIKIPDSTKVMAIPKNLKNQTQQIELNTVDVLYFSHDWTNCFLVQGLKNRIGNRATINLTLPEKLSSFESDYSSSFNLSSKRNLYLMNEKSPYTIPLRKIQVQSSTIRLNPSRDDNPYDEQLDIELTQKGLATIGTVKLIDEIHEKDNNGYGIVFIMGTLVGFVIAFLVTMFLMR